jgi:3-oxoacyl-[acyl-carrier protein] reductase
LSELKFLKGKTAIVTGSSKRLGKAILLELAKNGANVVVHYNTSSTDAKQTTEEALKLGTKAIHLKADLSKPREVEILFRKAYNEFGRIDILVNNVGTFLIKTLENTSIEDWNNQINTTLNGTFYCCKTGLPYLRKTKGNIINIGTGKLGDLNSQKNTTAYHIAKTGVLILTKSLAVEEAKNGITVNLISPGILFNSQPLPQKKIIPSGQYTTYSDINRSILILINSNQITGNNIKVSGGYGI